MNGERRPSFKQSNNTMETDLRTMRMRKFSETSTTTLTDHEHNHNSYKFKNYIKQRFSQDNHLEDKVGSSSGNTSSSTDKSENLSKKRRTETSASGDDHDDEKVQHNGHAAVPEYKVDINGSGITNGRQHPINSVCVPIFALHTQGYYIPLTVEYNALVPYLGETDLLSKICSQLPPLHPVNINVNFSPPYNGSSYSMPVPRCQFRRPKVENGW